MRRATRETGTEAAHAVPEPEGLRRQIDETRRMERWPGLGEPRLSTGDVAVGDAGAAPAPQAPAWPAAPGAVSRRVKRALDVVGALAVLVVSAPVLVVAIALIRATSRGPAFFVHTRKGRDGEEIDVLKLRTMRSDAPDGDGGDGGDGEGSVFITSGPDDPRVTPVGRVLRKLSIDELPQLVNVLKGEMSLVGPRPITPDEVRALPLRDRRLRASVPPGITGLWQVSGRNDCTDRERIRLDRRYVEEWSLGLDLEILLRTIPAVLTGRGAN